MTVQEVLNWSDKHKKLKGEGVRVVHVQQLLKQFVDHIKACAKDQSCSMCKEFLGRVSKD